MLATFFSKRDLWRSKGFLTIVLSFTILSLIVVWILGRRNPAYSINGASAWIPIGPLHLQPAEIAKITLVLYLSNLLMMRQRYIQKGHLLIDTVSHTIGPFMLIGFMILLVLIEPDTGGTAILLAITLIMTLASGFPWRRSLLGLTSALAAAGAAFVIMVTFLSSLLQHKYWFKRFLAVLHPFELDDDGRQLRNSLYAIHHGGLTGVGFGKGILKTGYLPEPYTDFILSTIAEELGIIGAVLTVGAIIFLVIRIVYIGIRARNQYHALLMYGIGTLIMIQTIFNVGAVIGLLPITGVTLPFISYGGSSLLVLSIAVGMVLNVSARENHEREIERNGKHHA